MNAGVQTVAPGTEAHVAAAAQPVPKQKRKRGPSKRTREALEAAHRAGYDEAMARDKGPTMLGTVLAMAVCNVGGIIVGWMSRGLFGG